MASARRPEPGPPRTDDGAVRRTRTSVTDDAITRIRQMILTGELAPGDRLPPEADLAANLGLSRTSLREAVRALTLLGVIDTRQGDASYITSLGPELLLGALGLAIDLQREDSMPDLVAVRRILEPAATAMAAPPDHRPELQHLRSLIPSRAGGRPADDQPWSSTGSSTTPSPGRRATTCWSRCSTAWRRPPCGCGSGAGCSVPGALERTVDEHQADRRRPRGTRRRPRPRRGHPARRRRRGLGPLPGTGLEHACGPRNYCGSH